MKVIRQGQFYAVETSYDATDINGNVVQLPKIDYVLKESIVADIETFQQSLDYKREILTLIEEQENETTESGSTESNDD